MIRFTLIARQHDGLALTATMESFKEEDQISHHKKLSKSLLRMLSSLESLPPSASILSGEYTFHYLIVDGVIFLTLCDKSYPRLLAFSFLTEIEKGFFEDGTAATSVKNAVRPYSFIKFEPFIQSAKKRYSNTRNLRTDMDLVDLSSKIQSVSILQAANVFGTEYTKFGATAFGSLAHGALKFESDVSRTWRIFVLILMTGLVTIMDLLNLARYFFSNTPSDSEASKHPFGHVLLVFLGILAPILLIQMYELNKTGSLSPALSIITTIHSLMTALQTLYYFELVGFGTPDRGIIGGRRLSFFYACTKAIYTSVFIAFVGLPVLRRWISKMMGHQNQSALLGKGRKD